VRDGMENSKEYFIVFNDLKTLMEIEKNYTDMIERLKDFDHEIVDALDVEETLSKIQALTCLKAEHLSMLLK
jgi:hypothetical protein